MSRHRIVTDSPRPALAMKLLAVVMALASMLVASAAPASAHSYDGNPSGEGRFRYWNSPNDGESSFTVSADDTKKDGHCVYIKLVFDGGGSTVDAYSCGRADIHTYESVGSGTAYKCITGHWDCDFLFNFV